jgi:hypothetical protein
VCTITYGWYGIQESSDGGDAASGSATYVRYNTAYAWAVPGVWPRVLAAVLALGAAAAPNGCGATTAATTDDGGALGRDASAEKDGATMPEAGAVTDSALDDASDAPFEGRVPAKHRATAVACPEERGPSTVPAACIDSGSPPYCLSDSQCTMGNNGRCQHVYPLPGCFFECSYDACFTDSDCPAPEPCGCRASATDSAPNTCLAGSECRVDADCGSGGYCSPSMGPYSGSCGIAYFCHTAVDTCLDDSDCDGGLCRYDTTAGHWACADGDGCVPPP